MGALVIEVCSSGVLVGEGGVIEGTDVAKTRMIGCNMR